MAIGSHSILSVRHMRLVTGLNHPNIGCGGVKIIVYFTLISALASTPITQL